MWQRPCADWLWQPTHHFELAGKPSGKRCEVLGWSQFSCLTDLSHERFVVKESRAKGGAKNLGSPSLAVALADIVQQIKVLAQANGLEGESLAVAHPDASGHKLVNGCGLRMAVRRNRSKPEARTRASLQRSARWLLIASTCGASGFGW